MADRYWVGGTDTWDATAGTKWALTSGGAGGQAVPTNADDVFFDSVSGTVVVTLSTASTWRNINCTGFTGELSHPTSTNITFGDGSGGSLTFVSTMTYTTASTSSALTFASTTTGNTITSGGKTFGNVTFSGTGGGWVLADSFSSGFAGASLTHTRGTLDNSGGFTMSWGVFSSSNSNTRAFDMTGTSFNLANNSGVAWQLTTSTNMTLTTTGSTISMTSTSANGKTFAGGGLTYNNLTISAGGSGAITITGSNTIPTFTVNAPKTLTITAGTTQTITTLVETASQGNTITLNSSSAGSAGTLSKSSGTVTVNYWIIQDSTATGGATWKANNSTNVSGNSGWVFSSAGSGRFGAGGFGVGKFGFSRFGKRAFTA